MFSRLATARQAILAGSRNLAGEAGSGAGKGGGSGGSIRNAGGSMGRKEVAEEERYFKSKDQEKLKDIAKKGQTTEKPKK